MRACTPHGCEQHSIPSSTKYHWISFIFSIWRHTHTQSHTNKYTVSHARIETYKFYVRKHVHRITSNLMLSNLTLKMSVCGGGCWFVEYFHAFRFTNENTSKLINVIEIMQKWCWRTIRRVLLVGKWKFLIMFDAMLKCYFRLLLKIIASGCCPLYHQIVQGKCWAYTWARVQQAHGLEFILKK